MSTMDPPSTHITSQVEPSGVSPVPDGPKTPPRTKPVQTALESTPRYHSASNISESRTDAKQIQKHNAEAMEGRWHWARGSDDQFLDDVLPGANPTEEEKAKFSNPDEFSNFNEIPDDDFEKSEQRLYVPIVCHFFFFGSGPSHDLD